MEAVVSGEPQGGAGKEGNAPGTSTTQTQTPTHTDSHAHTHDGLRSQSLEQHPLPAERSVGLCPVLCIDIVNKKGKYVWFLWLWVGVAPPQQLNPWCRSGFSLSSVVCYKFLLTHNQQKVQTSKDSTQSKRSRLLSPLPPYPARAHSSVFFSSGSQQERP
jgi:hypothetical protein